MCLYRVGRKHLVLLRTLGDRARPGRLSLRSSVKRRPKQIIAASAVDAGSNCAGNVLRWRSFTSGRSPHAAGALAVPRYRDRLSCGQQRHFQFISHPEPGRAPRSAWSATSLGRASTSWYCGEPKLPLSLSSSRGHSNRVPISTPE